MKLRSRLMSTAVAAIGIGLFSTFAIAQDSRPADGDAVKSEKRMGKHGRKHGKRGGMHRGGGFGFKALNLTDAQKEQIRQIREANKPDEATMQEMRSLREAKRAGTLTADQTERMQALRTQMQARHAAVREQMLTVLTPEQRVQMEQHKQQMQERREQFRQKRQERRQQRTTSSELPVS